MGQNANIDMAPLAVLQIPCPAEDSVIDGDLLGERQAMLQTDTKSATDSAGQSTGLSIGKSGVYDLSAAGHSSQFVG